MKGLQEMIGRLIGLGPFSGWRRTAVTTRDGLIRFLAAEAAFTVQKTAYGYCRARVGRQQDKLVSEPDFIARMEPCRWHTAAAVLADMLLWWLAGVAASGGADRLRRLMPGLYADALAALGPPPEAVGPEFRQAACAAFARRLEEPLPDRANIKAAFDPGFRVLLETLPFNRDLVEWDAAQIRHTFRLWVVHHCDRQGRMLTAGTLIDALTAGDGAGKGEQHGTGVAARA